MLKNNSSGWVEFSVVSDLGAVYSIKRLDGPGDIQWQVSRRAGPDDIWVWTKRWGLPVTTTGAVHQDERAMISSITGPDLQGGLQRLWDRILANPGIAIDRQGDADTPEMVEDVGAVTHYQGWTHGTAQGPALFARQVLISSRSSSAAVPVGIRVHQAVIAHPGTVPAGWPIAR